jgi:hypothetical protein
MPRQSVWSIALLCVVASPSVANEHINLNIPAKPPTGTQILKNDGKAYQGYSMEFASYPFMAGNLS